MHYLVIYTHYFVLFRSRCYLEKFLVLYKNQFAGLYFLLKMISFRDNDNDERLDIDNIVVDIIEDDLVRLA